MTTQTNLPHLLSSFDLQGLSLDNRVVMAPLTRSRAGAERMPNALMKEYYTQRAGVGLIITEGYYYLYSSKWLATYPWYLYARANRGLETNCRFSTGQRYADFFAAMAYR